MSTCVRKTFIEEISVQDLSSTDVNKYCDLTMREKGALSGNLRRVTSIKKYPKRYPYNIFHYYSLHVSADNLSKINGTVLALRDSKTKQLLAWALLVSCSEKAADFQVYTRISERNKGFGSALFKKAKTLYPTLYTHPWGERDNESRIFFAKMEKTQ